MEYISGTQQILYPENYICDCADHYIACKADEYLRYYKYKVGKTPDINHVMEIERVRRIACGNECGLCPDEVAKIRERLNKLLL